jgi:hypothetical protein
LTARLKESEAATRELKQKLEAGNLELNRLVHENPNFSPVSTDNPFKKIQPIIPIQTEKRTRTVSKTRVDSSNKGNQPPEVRLNVNDPGLPPKTPRKNEISTSNMARFARAILQELRLASDSVAVEFLKVDASLLRELISRPKEWSKCSLNEKLVYHAIFKLQTDQDMLNRLRQVSVGV